MSPYLIDTTLRDGEQAPGVAFSTSDKLHIASLLHELGIDEVEAGTPAISASERESIKEVANAGFSFKTSCWCRAKIQDLKLAMKLKTDAVNISLPVSDIQIETLGKSRKWVLKELIKVLNFAVQNFSFVTVGAQDATRAELKFLKKFISFALANGAKRVRINDTVGVYDSLETRTLFNDLVWNFPGAEFEFHGHNDFGMATANAITALKSGAKCISGTINGLGERAGNTVIEELIAYLHYKGFSAKYNTLVLKEISRVVAEKSNYYLPSDKPITGKNVFTHESGIHTSAMQKNMNSYQALNPKHFGVDKNVFIFGKHSGMSFLKKFFEDKDVVVVKDDLVFLLDKLEKYSLQHKSSITESKILSFFYQLQKTESLKPIPF